MNLSRSTIAYRIRNGWDPEEARTTPPHGKWPVRKIREELGIARATYYSRLRSGWTKEAAATTPRLPRGIKRGTQWSVNGMLRAWKRPQVPA